MPDRRRVRAQDPRDYTVQIRVAGSDEIVGTGVIVDAHRVVTCTHVVEAVTGDAPRAGGEARLDVYYPQAAGASAEKTRAARVQACFETYDDDVVLLALERSAPIGPERYAGLGHAEPSSGHPFRAYGYKRLGKYQAGYAYGRVLGCTECPLGFTLQADPVELDSPHLVSGMSGAGVLDMERNLVVGLVSEVYYAPDDKNRDVGWAVDARVLSFDPLNLPLAEAARPREEVAPPPEMPDPRSRWRSTARPRCWRNGWGAMTCWPRWRWGIGATPASATITWRSSTSTWATWRPGRRPPARP